MKTLYSGSSIQGTCLVFWEITGADIYLYFTFNHCMQGFLGSFGVIYLTRPSLYCIECTLVRKVGFAPGEKSRAR